MFNEYCIGAVGIKNECSPPGRTILLDKVKYELLIDVNVTRLISDVRHAPEFRLKPFSKHDDESNIYLGLFFQPWLSEKHATNIRSKYRILSIFFDLTMPSSAPHNETDLLEHDDLILTPVVNSLSNSVLSISELYSMLRDAHEQTDDIPHLDLNIPNYFVPDLRSYQLKALRWMLYRETVRKHSLPEFLPVKCYSIPNQHFYFNFRTIEIMDHDPGGLRIPSGGILADEMGLGKTVEMLALILCNRKQSKRKRDDENDVEAVVCKGLQPNQNLKCVCSRTSRRGRVIQCAKCLFFQHKKCVTEHSEEPILDYMCADCWKLQPPIESSATFIVSPPSIKMQWHDEIKKHISGLNFKVLIYNGIKQSGWISPNDLAKFDVVLTDYNIMKSEIYYSSTNKRESITRSQPRYIIPTSPLTMIHWWRVVLDEAQMVETPKNNCSRMVKSLPATHRWSVTGTPIEKSIDNLYGLMHFLDYEPYSDLNTWKNLTVEFNHGNAQPLINQCLKNVMWRTCKINVWEEIGLPPQEEIVHNITMSDLQAFFYSDQHQQCTTAFYEKAQKLGKSLSMFKMNPKTLKLIMEPLRKLRQDCTVPTVFQRTNRQESAVKKILTPDELLKHMVSNNEINCKERLRMIASCLNGLAALHIIKEEFDVAIKMYKSVLRWAKDYTGTICVDSLLQVHALHNLLQITEVLDDTSEEMKTEYSKELERLESKYLDNTRVLVKMAKEQQMKFENDILTRPNEADDNKLRWWADYLQENINIVKLEQQILDRIYNELRNYQNPAIESITSFHGVMYVITDWLQKIQTERKVVQKWFGKLDFFTKNLNVRHVLSSEQQDIDLLVKSAFHCHLDQQKEKETEKKKQPLCLLCQVKQVLLKYECLIFDKIYIDDVSRENLGNWNPCYQEMILKVIYAFAKRESNDESIVKDGEIHLQIIDMIKDEYKEYSKYWVEVNYAAAAYDELKMCKSRMEVYDPHVDGEGTKSKLKVSKYEVNETITQLRQEKQVAEGSFIRIQGTINYLKHLENNKEPDVCPICKEMPTMRYCVLQCGHHLCYVCFLRIEKIHRTNYKCCVCRHSQKTKDIYYVTCKRKEATVGDGSTPTVVGDYSTKIEEIVLTTLKLRKDDPDVKVIIFSHWESILNVISTALAQNGIQYRSKSAKFHKSIDEFKDANLKITCLLLPLVYGSKGLNLIEATHIFLVEPILNPAEEFQAIGRIHRIGQTKPTFVHRFIVLNTIEETIFNTISNDKTGKWKTREVTVDNLKELFTLNRNEA